MNAEFELKTWAKDREYRVSKCNCIDWLVRGRCDMSCGHAPYNFMDHVTGFIHDEGRVLVAQPYELRESDISDLNELCRVHNLKLVINGSGWYGYGTVCIMLAKNTSAL
jgi:hypothetical protein